MTDKPSIYFVATEFGEVHHGPAVYTRALWDLFHDSTEFDFHLVTLSSDLVHPRIHTPPKENGKRRGFYHRMATHILKSVPRDRPNVLLHVNSAHLISSNIAAQYRTVVQINDTEVCQHKISLARIKQYGLRRMIALQWRRRREQTVAKNSEMVVGNSDFTTQTVRDRYNLPESDVTRIYKAVPITQFLNVNPEPPDPKHLRLVFIGSHWERKGLRVLIEAVGILKQNDSLETVRLDVYGCPAEAESSHFRQFAVAKDVETQVRFCGVLQRADAPKTLANASMLVLSSFEEALGLVTIEAIATGIPVVGSHVGGIPEVINHPHLGQLVPPGNPQTLASAIISQHRDDTSEQKIRFRKDSSRRFDTDTLKLNVAAFYDQLFSNPSTD